MSVAVILPARLQSTRLPNKLLLTAGGKTILEHTIARAKEAVAAGLDARIIVAADDEQLMAVAKRAGVDAVLTRRDHTSGTDRIAEAAATLKEDIIVNLQADEPEIDPRSIQLVAGLLSATGETAPMATLAVPIFDAAEWKKSNVVKVVVSGNGRALYFSRAPIPLIRDEPDPASRKAWTIGGKRVYGLHHLGIYAYTRAFLLSYKTLPASKLETLEKLEQLRALEAGYAIKVGIVERNPPGIDTPEDFEAFVKRLGR
jgi:3-deoxy-manno-octulosonate cytidylyltransferase (CMP-KDO synthetase)